MTDTVALGREIRARREAQGMTLRALARLLGLSPSTLSLAERGGPVIGAGVLDQIAVELKVTDAVRDQWRALAGRLPDDLTELLLAHPAWWGEVRAMLAAVVRCGNCKAPRPPGAAWVPVTVPWATKDLRLCPDCEARGKAAGIIVPKGERRD